MNQFDALRCSICFNDYDLGDHIPRILPKCGHTVCSKCLDRILEQPKPRCPLDKHSIKRKVNRVFPVNFTVRHILEETSECDMCTVHRKKLKFLCLTDKCKLCKHCVEFSDHKEHSLKPITEAKVEADNKRQKLEQALTVLDEFHKEVGNILEEKKSELSSRIEEGFDELISLMLLKKSCLLFEVDCIFEQEKNKLRYVVGEDSPLRKKILDKIDTFKGFVTKRDFFSIMNFNLLHPTTNLDKSIFQGHVEEFKTNLDGYFDLFDCYFQSQTDMLSKFNIPSQAWVDNLRIGENKEEENQDGISETTWETEDKNCPFEIISSLQVNPNNQGYLEIISKDVIPTQVLINIEEWKQMKGIWLQLGQPRLSEQNTRTLAYILSKMEQINSIWITGENQANIFEDDLISLLDLLFARTDSLEQISISFNYSRITDRTIVHIADKILSRIVHLNSFEVCLGATYITNQAIRALSRSILPYTETLNTFRLEIGRTGVTEDIVGEMFVSMPKVKNFMLGVSSINLSDKAIENFVKNTLCSMESLELLSLWLQNTKITDQSVIKLFNSIKKVKTLQTSFENTLISDKSMEVLANSNLFKMKDLKDFEINLNGTWVTELTKIHILTLKERLLAEPQRWLQGLEVCSERRINRGLKYINK